jgi:asparagine synthase (glutamine-hydrolysing)
MSGVFGVLDSRRQMDIQSLLNRIGNAICYRDGQVIETYWDQREGVGLGRAGIGVFNRAAQPVWNDQHTIALVMAGEFSGKDVFEERRADWSDEMLALHLYETLGEDFVSKLQGAYILAIWDQVNRKLIIANDRFGLYPLYYAHFRGRFLFSLEMKGILCDSEFNRHIDLQAIAEYMRFQHILGDKTFFENLKILRNASILSYDLDSDRLQIKPYWDINEIPTLPHSLTFEDAVEEAGRLLKAAVDECTSGNHNFGVYLSGGLDSRVILGMIDRQNFPINTITYGARNCRDVIYARRLAKIAGSDHHYFEIKNGDWIKNFSNLHLDLTEGFHSWIHSHGIQFLDQVRTLLEVNLTGFGGGQSAIDWEDPPLLYARDDFCFNSHLFNLLSQHTTWPSLNDAEERELYSPVFSKQMVGLAYDSFLEELTHFEYLPYYQRAAYFALSNPDRRLFQYFTVFHRLAFEQRFPFYNYDFFKFVYALPPEMLFKRRLRRAIIVDRLNHLSHIPYDKDNLPVTGNEFACILAKVGKSAKSYLNHRLPRMFPKSQTLYTDYENSLRAELKGWGEELLFSNRSQERGFFNPEFVKSLWTRHQSGLEVNMIGKVAPLMTFEMVMRNLHDQAEISEMVEAPFQGRVLEPILQDGNPHASWVDMGKRQPASSSQQLQLTSAKG